MLGAVRGPGPGLSRLGPAADRTKRVSVEIGVSLGWERWVGDEGAIIGLDHFGASAPAGTIFEHFGFTADRVTDVGAGCRGCTADRPRRRAHGRRTRATPRIGAATPARPTRDHGLRCPRCESRSPPIMPGPRSRTPCWRASRADRRRHDLIDLGGDGSDPADDYPDFAERLGRAIQAGERRSRHPHLRVRRRRSVAANKLRGIRAAVCHDTYSAHQGVEHDDMNVLTLGSRVIGPEPAFECAIAFLGATFSGEPRHGAAWTRSCGWRPARD